MKLFIVLGLVPLLSAKPYNPFTDNLLDSPVFQEWNSSYFFNPLDSSYSFLPFNSSTPSFDTPSFDTDSLNPFGFFGLSSDDNIGFQMRTMSQTLAAALRAISLNPSTAETLDRIFADESICLTSVEELIQATEEGTQLVELAEGDILTLKARVENMLALGEDIDEATSVRTVASLLRALDPLVAKIAPTTLTVCNGSPDNVVSSLLSMSEVIKRLATDPRVSTETRTTFSQFSQVVGKVTTLVGQLRDQTNEFSNFCAGDKQSSANAIKALGEIIRNLSDMTASLGNEESEAAVRKGNELTEKIAVSWDIDGDSWFSNCFFFQTQLEQMKDIDVGDLDCSATDINGAATAMEDLANIIEEVGIETLKAQLGVDF